MVFIGVSEINCDGAADLDVETDWEGANESEKSGD